MTTEPWVPVVAALVGSATTVIVFVASRWMSWRADVPKVRREFAGQVIAKLRSVTITDDIRLVNQTLQRARWGDTEAQREVQRMEVRLQSFSAETWTVPIELQMLQPRSVSEFEQWMRFRQRLIVKNWRAVLKTEGRGIPPELQLRLEVSLTSTARRVLAWGRGSIVGGTPMFWWGARFRDIWSVALFLLPIALLVAALLVLIAGSVVLVLPYLLAAAVVSIVASFTQRRL